MWSLPRRYLSGIPSAALLVSAAAVGVAVAESAVLMLRFNGGRPSDSGYAWLTQWIGEAARRDFLGWLPAYFARFYELGSIPDLAPFLAAAILVNVLLGLLIAVPAAAAVQRIAPGAGGRLAVWLLSLSPMILHLASETSLPGMTKTPSPVRIGTGAAVVVVLWALLWPVARSRRFELRSKRAPLAILLGGCLITLGGAAAGRARTEAPGPAGAGPNILLISIDSLRADHVHAYGYERETSPHIDRLAKEGVLYRYAVAPTSWTLPSHVTMLTSLPPPQHQVTGDFTRLRPEAVTLTEVLRDNGYATAGFVSGPYLQAEYGYAQGFDLYDDYSAMPRTWNVHQKVTSPPLIEAVTAWLDEWDRYGRERPFFVFLHMWDVHYDYNAPEPHGTMFDPDYTGTVTAEDFDSSGQVRKNMDPRDLEHIVALYDGEIRYTDEHVGRLLEFLRGRGLLDDSVVAVTSDHGEEFYEHGNNGHRKSLYDEVLLVPFVVRYPKRIEGGQLVTHQVRLLDLAPTLLGLAGVKAPADFGMTSGDPEDFGRDLTRGDPPPPREYGFLDWYLGSVRTDRWKLVVHVEGEPKPEIYDLAADPGERTNLATTETERLDAFYGRLMALRKSGHNRVLAESMEVNQEHLKALRSLGYLTGYVEEALKPDLEVRRPGPGSKLEKPTIRFEWAPVDGVEYYYLKVGSALDSEDIYSRYLGKSTSATVTGIPMDGRPIHVRLYARIEGELVYADATYTARVRQLPCVGTVEFRNLSGSRSEIRVGDRYQVEIHGPADESVTLTAVHNGQVTTSISGYTDSDGCRVIDGVMQEPQIGEWRQSWSVGGRCLTPELVFTVVPAPGQTGIASSE